MKYIFAIDETGRFSIPFGEKHSDKSFACGVLVKGNELELKQAYQKVYQGFGFPEPVPTTTRELLTVPTENENDDNARFHFNRLTNEQKDICKQHLLPFVDEIYVSKGKPLLFANNQSWWLIAVSTIIKDFLQTKMFGNDDTIEIWIDNRNEKVLGLVDGDEIIEDKHRKYHNNIKQQIKDIVQNYVPNKNNLKIFFNSDTSNFFINLADIVCGFVRKEKDCLVEKTIKECSCKKFYEGDPTTYHQTNPLLALNMILQEVDDDNFRHIELTQGIIARLRKKEDIDDFVMAWDMFYDFLKSEIKERESDSSLAKKKNFVNIFLEEFRKDVMLDKLSSGEYLEMMVLFVEYFSHIGDINTPFERKELIRQIKRCDRGSETRTLRKWEKMISYALHESQIYFNGYNFATTTKVLEDIWEKHGNILNLLKDVLPQKDEPTTALIGTLAQAYAFEDKFDEAVEYFELSKEYAIKSTARTHSYLFNIYHRQKNIEKCREHFELSCGKTPEEYYRRKEFDRTWDLLLYCKLRALELYKKRTTTLPAIDLTILKNYNSEYPFPLVMKWEGVALWLENGDADKDIIEKYFTDALNNLLDENNGFTIRTLALPIVQCYTLINNQNPFYAKYDNYLAEFIRQSEHFKAFVSKKPILENIKNKEDIWERSMSLPFYYA